MLAKKKFLKRGESHSLSGCVPESWEFADVEKLSRSTLLSPSRTVLCRYLAPATWQL